MDKSKSKSGAQVRHPISIELLVISFVQIIAILSSLWLITEPDNTNNIGSELFYKSNRYTAIGFGFFIVFAMIGCLATRQVGFGYIMLVLSGVFYGELMRNTLSSMNRIGENITDSRIFVMSNLVIVFSFVFSFILFALYILERTGLV